MEVRRTRRGTTIRLADSETTELLTAFALTMAAYGILQNFMTPAQKDMALPSILFISRLGATVAGMREGTGTEAANGRE